MGLPVGQVARLAGITVRTLHHYDEIGLLTPGERAASGYRYYTDGDLERLEQVLFYRELGFALEEIAAILAEPGADRMTHLRRQHELLMRRIARLREMAAAVELAMEAHTMGFDLSPAERLEVFGEFRPEEHEAEAEERWGGGREFAESRRRVAAYTKQDWLRLREEGEEIVAGLAAVFAAGEPPGGAAAMDLAERHRGHITRWFYDCGYDIHRGLGEMYVADERFAVNFEGVAPGLAVYVRDAIAANAARGGS
ncbi:MerR family transcriptional regulator [Spongiactinospora rosea]|uniref:MerR family transcriptional regulator n=1 Tax=Spongiactinospora rosea TaxID=2248750 RepID=A0A366LXZ0_9ACTN|nr:MerR family transcriptional regulator [Spongiactinospora rosea]RBQ18815.1 MerR family transcriptional regulator [Spongiactinospora rosea]